jgi:hypothetical protein
VLSDTATLSGGYLVSAGSPAPTVTFSLIAPSGSTVYTETQPVTSAASYSSTLSTGTGVSTTGSDVAAQVGAYYWDVSYNANGSPYDSSVTANGQGVASETLTTTTASPALTTTPGGPVVLSSNISISGTKYLDLTGNGFSSDDTPQGGVTIDLYNSSGSLVASAATASNGSYSFTNLAPGTYYVAEAVPGGYVQTGGGPNGTAGCTYYTVCATAGNSYTGYNFDDYQVPTCQPCNVSYVINGRSYSCLDGNTTEGATVTVNFTTTMAPETLTLVSYYAPGSSFSDSNAYQQLIYQDDTQTFTTTGAHSLTVKIPNSYYQIDFVCGQAIGQFEPNASNYGPDSANVTYHAEGRFIDSDNGGWTLPSPLNTSSAVVPNPQSSPIGSSPLNDSATLSGGMNPGGTLTFYLMGPTATASTPLSCAVYTDVVTVTANGTYSTATQGTNAGGYAATSTGVYNWVVVYSGDTNNSKLTSSFGSEQETVYAPVTISGTKYHDATGNGFSCGDVGQAGVTIDLFDYVGSTLTEVASTTTDANGNYSFTALPPGTYYVAECVPSGYVQTGGGPYGSAGNAYYVINAQAGQTYGGNNFDDFQVPTCTPTNVCYTVSNGSCQSRTYSTLSGNTQQGDVVTVTFTVSAGMNDQLTLVSYTAPGSSFNAATAYEQQIFDEATGTFSPGTHTLTVCIPNCYYQIDFVCGSAITELGPPNTGPDSGDIFYSAQDRLIGSDNGGTQSCPTKSVCAGDYGTTGFWATSNGQQLINLCNGNSNCTNLAQWLCTHYPDVFGSGGCISLVNSNGSCYTNSQVGQAYKNCSGTNQQFFSTCLSLYCTSTNLAGSGATNWARNCGLNVSAEGSCGDNYNVGSNGSACGVSNNSSVPVSELLFGINCSTSPGAGFSSGAGSVCTGINNSGNVRNATLGGSGAAYSPDQVRTAYGVNDLALDGTGQTIAIVDAYDNPNIFDSVDAFDAEFGTTAAGSTLYSQYGPASSFLTVVNQGGQTTNLPTTDPTGGWELEEALDVEWVHAMAPGAQIILVEANSQSLSDLMGSVKTAASLPGVSVVSMSWGFAEGQSVLAADEATYDQDLTTPAGHTGVTFVASTGDYGTSDPEYPAFSPNVVAVGGTSLSVNADSSYNSETGWGGYNSGVGASIGGGGGFSQYEAEPAYQEGVQTSGYRTTPDVSLVADPATGAWIADTYNLTAANPFEVVGGTSLAAPAFAGLIALADQGRAEAGESPLGNASDSTATQEALYSVPQSDYNAVTTGSNGYSATAGYNLVTGLGSPQANLLIPDLVAYSTPIDFAANSANATITQYSSPSASWAAGSGGATNVVNVFDALPASGVGTLSFRGATAATPVSLSPVATSGDPAAVAPTAGRVVGPVSATAGSSPLLPAVTTDFAGLSLSGLSAGNLAADRLFAALPTLPGAPPSQATSAGAFALTASNAPNGVFTLGGGSVTPAFAAPTAPGASLPDASAYGLPAADAVFVDRDSLLRGVTLPAGTLRTGDVWSGPAFSAEVPPELSAPCDDWFLTSPGEPLLAGDLSFLSSGGEETGGQAAVLAAGLAALILNARVEKSDPDGDRARLSVRR